METTLRPLKDVIHDYAIAVDKLIELASEIENNTNDYESEIESNDELYTALVLINKKLDNL